MPAKLSTTVNKIKTLFNQENARLILDFHEFMKENGASEIHQNNNLKTIITFSQFLGSGNLININERENVLVLLQSKIKDEELGNKAQEY